MREKQFLAKHPLTQFSRRIFFHHCSYDTLLEKSTEINDFLGSVCIIQINVLNSYEQITSVIRIFLLL